VSTRTTKEYISMRQW